MLSYVTSAIAVIVLVALAAANRKVTTPLSLVLLSVPTVISIVSCLYEKNYVMLCVPAFVIIAWGAFLYKFKSLSFKGKVFSLAMDKNKCKDGRVIGHCLPYYKKQLKYNNSTIVQSQLAMSGGMIVIGSSGSGKTFQVRNLIKQDVANGHSAAFFDFKGNKDIIEQIKRDNGDKCKIYELSLENVDFTYDPLVGLDEAGRCEAILNMRKWSINGNDDHYKTGLMLMLQKTVRDFKHTGGNYLLEYYKYVSTLNVRKEEYDAYNSLMKLLELSLQSEIGRKLFSDDGMREFKFDSDEQYVLIASFTSSTKALGTSITSLMFKDLMEAGTKDPYSPELCLYVDEFGSCESPLIVKDILEKGRSCGICPTIIMQDPNQLVIATNEHFLDSVLGTVNSYMIFPGSTKKSAEQMSGTQIYDIDELLMSLKKPVNGKPPTAVYISKYPVFGSGDTEVYRFTPAKLSDEKAEHKEVIVINDGEVIEYADEECDLDIIDVEQQKVTSPYNNVFDDEELPKTPKGNVEQTYDRESISKFL